MITDLDLALACEHTYSGAKPTWGTETAHAYSILSPGRCIIGWEGTTDGPDWRVNLEAIPVEGRTFNHQDLGLVHLGWWRDVEAVIQPIIAFLQSLPSDTELGCSGHSKGASEGLICAAVAKLAGIKWSRVSTFGTPHPGALAGLIGADLGVDYQFGDKDGSDPVSDVPLWLPRPRPITRATAPAPIFNTPNWGLARYHHMQNYTAAMRAEVAR